MGKHGVQWKKKWVRNFSWYAKKKNVCKCRNVWIWKYIYSSEVLKNGVDPAGPEWGQVSVPFEQENLASWTTISFSNMIVINEINY